MNDQQPVEADAVKQILDVLHLCFPVVMETDTIRQMRAAVKDKPYDMTARLALIDCLDENGQTLAAAWERIDYAILKSVMDLAITSASLAVCATTMGRNYAQMKMDAMVLTESITGKRRAT